MLYIRLLYLDIFDNLFLPVIPEAIVNPLPDEFQGRLRTKCVLCWHVQVVHERQQLFPSNWNIHTCGGIEERGEREGRRKGVDGEGVEEGREENNVGT